MMQGAAATLTVHVKAVEESFANAVIDTDMNLLASTKREIEILKNKKSLCEKQIEYYQKQEQQASQVLERVEALKLWKEIAPHLQQQQCACSERETRQAELKQTETRLASQQKLLTRLQSDLAEAGIDIGEQPEAVPEPNHPTPCDWESRLSLDDSPLTMPADFRICPITIHVMQDPVLASDGYTYERLAIEAWMERSNKSPITNLPLGNNTLVPNLIVRSLIRNYTEPRGIIDEIASS